ncbi:hypothetical protein Tco_0548116 [Tanacetum coccineum]
MRQCLHKVADEHFTEAVKVLSTSKFVASALLMPLLKLDNGIRPISVDTIWRRLVSKLNRVLSEYHNDGSLVILSVYFSNALNPVDILALLHEVRVMYLSISFWVDFLYEQVTRLYIGDTHIWYAIRVWQGDLLVPLFCALVLHPLVYKIKDSCKLLLHAWYLDDGTVIGDSEEVAKVLDIKMMSLGVKLLGGAISRDTDFISGLAMRRAANAVDFMCLLTRAVISAKKEAPVNFLTDLKDRRSTLRPVDVLVSGWAGGYHERVDLTEVSPLVGLSSRGFIMGQVALKAASCKVTKHKKACIKN